MINLLFTYLPSLENEELLAQILRKFPHDFSKGVLKYKRWQDGFSTVLGRLLLAYGLKNFHNFKFPVNLLFNESKKPSLNYSSLQFNISHSKELIACAISTDGSIGIDVEKVTEINWREFELQLTENEYSRIANSDKQNDEFFLYWTQKEAVLKANGEGLNIALNSFEITNYIALLQNKEYHLAHLHLDDGYKCHIATSALLNSSSIEVDLIKMETLVEFSKNYDYLYS